MDRTLKTLTGDRSARSPALWSVAIQVLDQIVSEGTNRGEVITPLLVMQLR